MPLIPMSEATVFTAIEPATYDAVLDEWEYVEESAASGNPYVKMTFAISDGEYEGRKLFRNFSAMPEALGYMKRALVALGAEAEEVSQDFDTDDILPDLVGNPCRIVVTKREYEGEEQNDIRRVLPPEAA